MNSHARATTERIGDDAVERVALALFDGAAYGPTRFALEKPWEQISPLIQAGWRTTAAAAIAAMPSHTEVIEALSGVREELAVMADRQADQRGDYLYRGHPDQALLKTIRAIEAAASAITEGQSRDPD